jgi:hypothetical protein
MTAMKTACRRLGIAKWPYRTLTAASVGGVSKAALAKACDPRKERTSSRLASRGGASSEAEDHDQDEGIDEYEDEREEEEEEEEGAEIHEEDDDEELPDRNEDEQDTRRSPVPCSLATLVEVSMREQPVPVASACDAPKPPSGGAPCVTAATPKLLSVDAVAPIIPSNVAVLSALPSIGIPILAPIQFPQIPMQIHQSADRAKTDALMASSLCATNLGAAGAKDGMMATQPRFAGTNQFVEQLFLQSLGKRDMMMGEETAREAMPHPMQHLPQQPQLQFDQLQLQQQIEHQHQALLQQLIHLQQQHTLLLQHGPLVSAAPQISMPQHHNLHQLQQSALSPTMSPQSNQPPHQRPSIQASVC